MDLPPPSYEEATGDPGIHNQTYPYSKSVSPTAPPPPYDEIITVDSNTRPMFSRPYRPNLSSNVQPNNQNLHLEISPKPETTHLNRDRNFVILVFVICALLVIISLIKANNQKPKYDFGQISEIHHNTDKEWGFKWWKDNEQMIKDSQDRANRDLENRRNNLYLGNND